VGSPIIDILAQVPDEFLATVPGAKGGMELVGEDTMEHLLGRLPGLETNQAPGGSAGNTAFALAKMGMPTGFLGKIGQDSRGAFYRNDFMALGGDASRFLETDAAPTATCLSLITPDSERTMRTFLGAATLLAPEEISTVQFKGFKHAHVEGYLLFNPALAEKVLRTAAEAGCSVSLDLGSFEVVQAAREVLPGLLKDYVTAVFANEDEAEAFWGHDDAEKAVWQFQDLCEVVAVKLGADGALIAHGEESFRAAAVRAKKVLDTTGAGDFWAAGFLFGLLTGQSLATCGRYGAILGAEVVQHLGAYLAPASWEKVFAQLDIKTPVVSRQRGA